MSKMGRMSNGECRMPKTFFIVSYAVQLTCVIHELYLGYQSVCNLVTFAPLNWSDPAKGEVK